MKKTTMTNCALAAVALLFNAACTEQAATNEEQKPKAIPETISLIEPETNTETPALGLLTPNDPLIVLNISAKTAELALITDPTNAKRGLSMGSTYIPEKGIYDTHFYITGGKNVIETNTPVALAFTEPTTTIFKNCHVHANKINNMVLFSSFHCVGPKPNDLAKAILEIKGLGLDEETTTTIKTSTQQFTDTVKKQFSDYKPSYTMI